MNLKGLLPDLKADYYIVEPSFLSPKYGLQGRLDLLMEYKEDENRKDIVELKSGSSPSHTYALTLPDGNTYQSGIWGNHLAQTTCYNLLLDSAFAGRTGSSQVLYSSAAVYPLRNAPNITRTKQDVLQFRNWVIALEHAMMLGNNTILQDLTPQNAKGLPSYISSELYNFSSSYLSATPLELEYFNTMLTFQLREIWSEKIGSDDNRNSGFASLWKESASEKEQQFSIITGLTFEPDGSDLENLHIKFKRSDTNQLVTSFRKGDIAILYLTDADDQLGPVNQQIMKCYIKEIGTDDVIISLRNKQFRQDFFDESKQYNLEPDYIETTSKNLYQSIFQFLRSDTNRKNLLLGLRQPEFIYNPYINIDELTQNQNDIVNRAISAKDYFLIQGPPGTGKTSYVLKNIAGLLFEKTDEDILILAYTNRAVDEICSALKNISPEMPFLRLGSKENSSHPDILLAKISENVSLIDLFERIRNTRVFVSTVSSVLANPELLEIKNFRTAIIDEASQILESQIIGILSRIDRFIMIGDERQLPSVVTQPEIGLQVKSKSLIDINLNTLGGSVFERLLKCCKNNGWDNAYGMLRQQVRMHSEIQTFPNSYFYGGLLETFSTDGWQHSEEQVFDINSDDRLEEMLASSRIIYIDSPREKISKLNRCEADRIVRLLQKIRSVYGEKFDSRTVGVITPFRAQCAEIIRRLDEDLLSKVTVDTVERFQGSEREIIIISFSVNNTALLANIQSICEIDDMPVDRKLNVSLTRARKHLILLGVSEVLQGSPIFANLINHIKDYGLYVESEEFEEIVKFPQ
jgi:DNA replication ATP-dependent helicase Dna2